MPSQRKAYALLVFGLVVGILCTRATLQVSMVPCWSTVPAGVSLNTHMLRAAMSNVHSHQAPPCRRCIQRDRSLALQRSWCNRSSRCFAEVDAEQKNNTTLRSYQHLD